MKALNLYLLLAFLFLGANLHAQTFQDSPGNENTGAFPSKWELIKGSAQIGNFDGSKVILIANKGIINPKLNSKNYLSQTFTLQFEAYFDKVTHHPEYQYYLIRFWDGAGHLVVPANNGNALYDPIKIFRHGAMITGMAGRSEKIEHKVIDNNLNGKTGIWRSLTVNYNMGTLKISIDGKQLINIPDFYLKPAMISIEGFVREYGVNFVRAIKNIKLDGIENTANTTSTTNTTNTSNTANTTNSNDEQPVANTNPAIGSIKINDLLDGKSDAGSSSVFLGLNAGNTDDGTNNKNVGLGFEALKNNSTGERNTATGYKAGLSNRIGSGNVFLGNNAGINETGSNKLYIANATTDAGSALIYGEFDKNILRTNGLFQIGIPASGGYVFPKTDGSSKQILQTDGNGNLTWVSNTSSGNTTTSGSSAQSINDLADGKSDSNGSSIFLGLNAGAADDGTDNKNVGIGVGVLKQNTIGSFNTASGYDALTKNGEGHANTSSGYLSLNENTIGSNNTATGYMALQNNVDGHSNTASGSHSLYRNTTGYYNTAIGHSSLHMNSTGSYNTAIGRLALGNNFTGSNNTAVGYFARVPIDNASNQVRIGNESVTYAGIQVPWTVTSDISWKENIRTIPYGLDIVMQLKPVDYVRKNNEDKTREMGFLGQDVETLLSKTGYTDQGLLTKDDKNHISLRYNDFIPLLTKAMQEQQAIIENLKARIEILEKK